MTNYKGIHKYAIYSSIAVHNAANKHRMDLGAYSGTTGDGMRACSRSSDNSDGMPFSTPDRDNDKSSRTVLSPTVQDGGSMTATVLT